MLRLGELERAVMDVLWSASGPVTARVVSDALSDRELALTTVLTVLSRLEAKGYVARTRDGRAHHYAATATREEHVAGLMHEVLDTAGESADNRSAVLVRFVGQVSREEAEALQTALAEALDRREASPE
ncbi:BlaI/MecI/CopY family transcriptional regulator [Fodinicola acaciae]|uniref:BlaI/MecI/CopY family transcriptional regulator n=1 Tax=Fodinicola acaciae TaxID=2681555 RepID=UPI0013D38ED6|nr:BlaI/MecI/CopY family transcriptional regulator [Fodinicola acaciae]